MPVRRAAGITDPACTIYFEAGFSRRSLLTVRLSIGPLRNASLRSCMFWIESASIGGLSPATSNVPLGAGGVDTGDGGAAAIERPDDGGEHRHGSHGGEPDEELAGKPCHRRP